MFAPVFNTLRDTGTVPSSHIASERVNEQTVDEVEDILQSAERSPSTSTRRISAVFHIQEYGGHYVCTYVQTAESLYSIKIGYML